MNRRRKLAVFIVAMASVSLARADIQDLGTLGGSASSAWDINENGQVVGWADTAMDGKHAFLWTAESGMLDLGTLGGPGSQAWAVNEEGQVVGEAFTSVIVNNAFTTHAFSWTAAGGMIDLGTLGGTNSYALAVSENGQVVGYSQLPTGETHAFSWTATGGMLDLGALTSGPSSFSKALAVNDAGRVVGETRNDAFEGRSFSWIEGNEIEDLGTLFGTYAYARALNNSGQVVGVADTSQSLGRAFLWTEAGGMVDLGTLTGAFVSSSSAWAINDSGQVVGESEAFGFEIHAMSWTETGGMVDLGLPPGAISSSARAVNDGGQIVGDAEMSTGDNHAFSWTAAGGIIDLGTLGGNFTYARDVNNSGQVVGESQTVGHVASRAVLWQQTPFTRLAAVPNVGGTASPELGVVLEGSLNGYVRDASSDALLGSLTYEDGRTALDVGVADIQGAPALAVLVKDATGRAWVEVLDAVTGVQVKDVWFSSGYTPIALAVLPDMNGNSISEVAVLLTKDSDNRAWVHIKDASTLAVVSTVWFQSGYTPLDLEYVPNVDGNAGPELAVLMTRNSDGRTWVHTKDAQTGAPVRDNWFAAAHTPKDLAVIDNLDGNPGAELAVLFTRDSDSRTWVHMKDTLTGAYVKNVWFDAGFTPTRLEVVPDLDTNVGDELAVLTTKDADGRAWVLVKDALSGAVIRNVWFQGGFAPRDFAVLPEIDANAGAELAVLGEKTGGQVQVEIKDAKTNAFINQVNFP